jgi:peptide deformylase
MASKDSIITLPDPALRTRSAKVAVVTDEVRQTIEDMKSATLDWEASRAHEVGVALAAIQINRPLKVIVIRNDFDNKDDKTFHVFINPKIVKLEGEIRDDFEGCLSVKDIYGKVPRYDRIRLRALDENGEPIRLRAEGFLARVIQHEVDHCDGITFVDHIKDKPDAFYLLDDDGKLNKAEYEQIAKSGIFRD